MSDIRSKNFRANTLAEQKLEPSEHPSTIMLQNFYVDRFVHFYDYVKIDGWVITDSEIEKIVLCSAHLLTGKMEHSLPSPDLGAAAVPTGSPLTPRCPRMEAESAPAPP